MRLHPIKGVSKIAPAMGLFWTVGLTHSFHTILMTLILIKVEKKLNYTLAAEVFVTSKHN